MLPPLALMDAEDGNGRWLVPDDPYEVAFNRVPLGSHGSRSPKTDRRKACPPGRISGFRRCDGNGGDSEPIHDNGAAPAGREK